MIICPNCKQKLIESKLNFIYNHSGKGRLPESGCLGFIKLSPDKKLIIDLNLSVGSSLRLSCEDNKYILHDDVNINIHSELPYHQIELHSFERDFSKLSEKLKMLAFYN